MPARTHIQTKERNLDLLESIAGLGLVFPNVTVLEALGPARMELTNEAKSQTIANFSLLVLCCVVFSETVPI